MTPATSPVQRWWETEIRVSPGGLALRWLHEDATTWGALWCAIDVASDALPGGVPLWVACDLVSQRSPLYGSAWWACAAVKASTDGASS